MAAKKCAVCAAEERSVNWVALVIGKSTKVLWFCKPEHRDEWEKAQACGHAELVAEPEIEGWENPTEPVQIILRCPECKQNARVVVDDVSLLPWTFDPWGDPS